MGTTLRHVIPRKGPKPGFDCPDLLVLDLAVVALYCSVTYPNADCLGSVENDPAEKPKAMKTSACMLGQRVSGSTGLSKSWECKLFSCGEISNVIA